MRKPYLVLILILIAGISFGQDTIRVVAPPPPPPQKQQPPPHTGPAIYLTGTGGYVFQDKIHLENGGDAYISDGGSYGAILTIEPVPSAAFELIYHRQDFTGTFQNFIHEDVKASVNYIMIGGCGQRALGDSRLFAGLNLGAAIFADKDDAYTDVWKFAVGGKLGAKIFPSPRVGILLQTNIDIPVQWASGGLYFGTGGAGAGVSTGSSITQFGFTGGLIFRLK